jgi:predicted acetyltransferase
VTPSDHPAGDLRVRPLSRADLDDILDLDSAAFGQDPPRDFLDDLVVPHLELDRYIGVRDPQAHDELVASAAILSKRLTFPGGGVHPVAGVTWVAVRPGWRRRGLLRSMITEQLHGLHATGGEPVAILTASEAALYGRYGYGQAICQARLELLHGASLRPGTPTDAVLETRAERARPLARALYERVAPTVTGHLSRTDAVWNLRTSDHAALRDGASRRRWALHPDGYACYRIKAGWAHHGPNSQLVLDEICAATALARASLWHYLMSMDLVRTVSYRTGWVDDPLRDLLQDPRRMQLTVADHVWLRIVDLDRAIGLRSYSAPFRATVEFTDALCPWNAGTWALDLSTSGGTVARSADAPQIRLDIVDLGAAFLGGTPVARLAAAGRVTGDPAAMREFGAALATPLAPWCPEGF